MLFIHVTGKLRVRTSLWGHPGLGHTRRDSIPLQIGGSEEGGSVQSPGLGSPSGKARAESCLDPQRTLSCWQSLQQWQISPFPSPSHFPLEPRIVRIPPEQSYLGRTRDIVCLGFPSGKESAYQCKRWGLIPGSGRLPGGGNGNSLPGQRSLAGYSPWGCKRAEHDWTTECTYTDTLESREEKDGESNKDQ